MSMAMKYAMQKRAKSSGCSGPSCKGCSSAQCMAEGGQVHETLDYTELKPGDRKGQSRAGVETRKARHQREMGGAGSESRAVSAEGRARAEHRMVLDDMKEAGKKDRKYLAEGGEAKSSDDDDEFTIEQPVVMGLVDRIMKKRMMSKGGEVANDTDPMADGESADYDVLADDDGLEFHETGANSGDEIGDKAEDEEEHDLVSRIMRSRGKKDRNPRPA